MKKKHAAVSMKDVAALAGVSVGTVSNVLNQPDRVLESTRQRVEDAIRKLGWIRNESARQLRAGRSESVGIVVMDVANPYFVDLLLGAEETFYDRGYTVNLGNSDQHREREALLMRHFMRSRVDGVLLAPIGNSSGVTDELLRAGIPVVLLDRVSGTGLCSVGMDDIEGGRLAVHHLLEQGHKRIAFVGGPLGLAQVRDRARGARLAVANSGAHLDVVEAKTLDVEEGRNAAQHIARSDSKVRPTAVFAANDLIAIGMLQGFVAEGLSVPDDVAIIGYDDIDFAAAAAVPLSSIRQPRYEMGRCAAELLLKEITAAESGDEHQHEPVSFSPELVARISTLRTS